MRDIALDIHDRPGARRTVVTATAFDDRPNPVLDVLRSIGEAISVALGRLLGRAVRMPFATLVVLASAWGGVSILGNVAGQAGSHPAPLFTPARAPDPVATARREPAPPVAAPARTAEAPRAPAARTEPERSIADILAETERPRPAAAPRTPAPDAARDLVRDLQTALARAGHYQGTVDGLMGPRTERAIRAAEAALGLPETGRATERLLERLRRTVTAAR